MIPKSVQRTKRKVRNMKYIMLSFLIVIFLLWDIAVIYNPMGAYPETLKVIAYAGYIFGCFILAVTFYLVFIRKYDIYGLKQSREAFHRVFLVSPDGERTSVECEVVTVLALIQDDVENQLEALDRARAQNRKHPTGLTASRLNGEIRSFKSQMKALTDAVAIAEDWDFGVPLQIKKYIENSNS